ncbi:porin [Diaphorobacter aerolatus]|uniref:porin n=1 Tax=Diaphorobacter aerolatus TaxID=1288495 RepID=UPI001D0231F3|nr:porin [Diaphorobacter aerolatus]
MKKEFGALCAVLIATSALPAAAQQARDFTVYGVMDLGVRRSSGLSADHAPIGTSQSGVTSGINDTSRWGVRGVTPLSGGLSTIWELESGINADTGTQTHGGKYFDRGSWIGLRDSTGSLLTVGRQTSLLADSLTSIDPLQKRLPDLNPNLTIGALSQPGLTSQYGNTGLAGNAYWLDNAVKFTSQSTSFRTSAMYSFGEQAGDRKPLSSTGLAMSVEDRGATLSGAYQTFKDAEGHALKAWTAGLAYQSGNTRLAASATHSKADQGDFASTTQRVYSLGATLSTTTKADWTLAYYKVARERSQYADDGFGRFVAFYEYKISYRTKLYAEFDLTNWDDGYQGPGNKSRATGFGVGMQYRF